MAQSVCIERLCTCYRVAKGWNNFRKISKNPRKIPNNPGKFPKFLESFQRFATLRTSQTKYTLQGCEYDYVYANVRVIYLFILYIVLKDPH